MGRVSTQKLKRLANAKKARTKRLGLPVLHENSIPFLREPSPIHVPPEQSPIIEIEVLSTDNHSDDQSNTSWGNESGDEYQEAQSNFLMSLKSLREIIHHMMCKRCKGANGDMWPAVTNLKGFKVEITVTCKCGYSFVHETFDQLDVNSAAMRCLIANGISLEAFQRFLIVMGFSYWSEKRDRYLSIDLTSNTFNSQIENQAIIDAADASEKKILRTAARQSTVTVSFDGSYKTSGHNSRSCFAALLVGKKVVASDVVKKEMRPSFKGECYGLMKSISSHAMECFLVELLLKRIHPTIGGKIQYIDTDGDAKMPKVIPKIQWEVEDSMKINPNTNKSNCEAEDVGQSIWKDGKCPELRTDKVCNHLKTLSSKSEIWTQMSKMPHLGSKF